MTLREWNNQLKPPSLFLTGGRGSGKTILRNLEVQRHILNKIFFKALDANGLADYDLEWYPKHLYAFTKRSYNDEYIYKIYYSETESGQDEKLILELTNECEYQIYNYKTGEIINE